MRSAAEDSAVEFKLLGPLEVWRDGERLSLTRAKQRALLAVLLLHANKELSTERLVDELWGDDPPPTARKALQVHVGSLRRELRRFGVGDVIRTRRSGYVLEVDPERVDVNRFLLLVRDGRAAIERDGPAVAASALAGALSLWRGMPLADVPDDLAFVRSERARLEELRLAAEEDRVDAELALGHHAAVLSTLERLTEEHPYRERVHGQRVLALYRSGRQTDALAAYRAVRRRFAAELGIEPGPALQALERAILRHDPSLGPPGHAVPRVTIPVPPTRLIGRERELEDVKRLVSRAGARLLTITGPGGVGKTRLALDVARALAPEFPDGTCFVDLSAVRDAALVVPAVARALELPEAPEVPPDETLRHFLAERRLLVVLDNFEHLLDAAPDVARALASSQFVKVLATSRAPLHLRAEYEFRLPPLRDGDAVALFSERVHAVGGEVGADDAAAICRRLDGLPLAIELAAARARTASAAELRRDLERGLDALAGGFRDTPQRQQTLRATIEWSRNLLDADTRSVFPRLSVFVGGFDAVSAQVVCDAGEDALTKLIEASLLRRQPDGGERLGMLETVREYAREVLVEAGHADSLERRHAEHFLERASRMAAARDYDRDALDADFENYRAALEHWRNSGDGERELLLATAIEPLWRDGRLREGESWFEDALARTATDQGAARARALMAAGRISAALGRHDRSLELEREAAALYRALADPSGLGEALAYVFAGAVRTGDQQAARTVLEEQLRLADETGDAVAVGTALLNAGTVALQDGRIGEAEELLERSIAPFRRVGAERGHAFALLNLGDIASMRGRPADALDLYRHALRIFDAERDSLLVSVAMAIVACALRSLRPEQAVVLLGAVHRAREDTGLELEPSLAATVERARHELARELGAESFEQYWSEGRSLSRDDAVARALAGPPGSRRAIRQGRPGAGSPPVNGRRAS